MPRHHHHPSPSALSVWDPLRAGEAADGPPAAELPWCMECASTLIEVDRVRALHAEIVLEARCPECGWDGEVPVGAPELAAWAQMARDFASDAVNVITASSHERRARRRAA